MRAENSATLFLNESSSESIVNHNTISFFKELELSFSVKPMTILSDE